MFSEPVRAPELFQSQWWERVDMYADFNELIVRNITIPVINQVPVIANIGSNSETIETANVTITAS